MSTFFAGLRARRWLNVGVFALGTLAMLVAVATPLYARSSAEHLLDQRTLQRPTVETGLNVETAPSVDLVAANGRRPKPLTDEDRQGMLERVTELMSSDAANSYWKPLTPYLLTEGTYRVGQVTRQINTYWREGMCEEAQIEGRCPSAPDEALIDPTMMRTIGAEVGGTVTVMFNATARTDDGSETVKDFPATYTIVGTYTIDDNADPTWYSPVRTAGDGTLRPPTGRAPPFPAPALLVDQSSITFPVGTVGGADRPIDMQKVDISTMDAAQRQLVQWQSEVAGAEAPVLQSDDVVTLEPLFDDVRAEQTLLSRITLAAVVPLVVLALLLLYVLISSAAEVRRQEVALAKLRGFSTPKVIRFAVAEPVAVLLAAVPVGIGLAVVASRTVTGLWLGQTPFVVTAPAVISAVVVVTAALVAAFVAVLGVVREPLASSLASVTRRRTTTRWSLLAQGGLVVLAAAAVVQFVTSDATSSSSFVELLAPLFVALGVSVLALAGLVVLARLWMTRTADRGTLSPFLASRRLVRRQDLMQLVLPLLLATSMATFAASAWKVADDWRVSKASATVGADRAYFTETAPARLLWVAREADPDGRYLMTAVPPAPRTEDGARVALVDSRSFANVVTWDDSWSSESVHEISDMLRPDDDGEPITFSGTHLKFHVTDIDLEASLNLPLEMWVRYITSDNGEEKLAPIGTLPMEGNAELDGFVSECKAGCDLEQLYVAGSSSSVTDATGTFTIADVTSDGSAGDWRLDDSSAWRAARPFEADGGAPLQLSGGTGGLVVSVDQAGSSVLRLTTTDKPESPPLVATSGTELDDLGGGLVNGASVLGTRTPMTVTGTAGALPMVGDNGGLSDLSTALREYGDQATNIPLTELLVARGTPASVLDRVSRAGVDLSEVRTYDDELSLLRSDAFSLGWKVFLLVGVLTLLLAFLGVLALAIVQLRWRAYEVAALRVVGVRRRDLRRAIVTEYVALLGMAVVGGALAAFVSLLLVLPSLDIGERAAFDPAVDYSLRWLVLAGVLGLVLIVVFTIALWIADRTVKLGTPATLRQADVR